ncbi:MAG: hypothetical protein ACXABY_18420 [Candidatus Thorarchaeota archaeon]|jgi:hypothetical protein
MQHGGQSRGPLPYAEATKRAERLDVQTVAQMCRRGGINVQVLPTSNGFVVTLNSREDTSVQEDLVYTRPEYVGRLMQALFNSNLENASVLKRLRTLMGYL